MGSNDNPDQSWKRPWTLNEVVAESNNWSLAADAGVCELLKKLSSNLLKDVNEIKTRLSDYSVESKKTNVMVQNAFNDLCMLANDQFMENLVEDVSSNLINDAINNENKKPILKEEKLLIADKEVSESLLHGMEVLNLQFEVVDVVRSNSVMRQNEINDDDELLEGEEPETLIRKSTIGDISQLNEPIYQPKDPYENRHLPHLVGTDAFIDDDTLGIGYIDEDKSVEDEDSDEEDENEKYQDGNFDSLSDDDEDDDYNDRDSLESHKLQSEAITRSLTITKGANIVPQTLSDDDSEDDMFASSPKEDLDDIFGDAPRSSQQPSETNEQSATPATQTDKNRSSVSSGDVFQDALMNQLAQKLSNKDPLTSVSESNKKSSNNAIPVSANDDAKTVAFNPKPLDVKKEKVKADSFMDIFEDDDLFAEPISSNIPKPAASKSKETDQNISKPSNIGDSIKSEQTPKSNRSSQQLEKKVNENDSIKKTKISALTWSDSDSDEFDNILTSITKKPIISKAQPKKSKPTESTKSSKVIQRPSLILSDDDDDDDWLNNFTKKPSISNSKISSSIPTTKIAVDNSSDNDLFDENDKVLTTNSNNHNVTKNQISTSKATIDHSVTNNEHVKKSESNDSSIKSPTQSLTKSNATKPTNQSFLSYDDEDDLFQDLSTKKTVKVTEKKTKPHVAKSQPIQTNDPLKVDHDSEDDLFKESSTVKTKQSNKSNLKPLTTKHSPLFSDDEDDDGSFLDNKPKPTMIQDEKSKETQNKVQEPKQLTVESKRNLRETIERKIENDAVKQKSLFGDTTDGDDDDLFKEANNTTKKHQRVKTYDSTDDTDNQASLISESVDIIGFVKEDKSSKEERPSIVNKKRVPGSVPIFQPNLMGELMNHSRLSKPKSHISDDDDDNQNKSDNKGYNYNNSVVVKAYNNPLVKSPVDLSTSSQLSQHNDSSVISSQTIGQSSFGSSETVDIDAPVVPVQRLSLLTKGRANPKRRPTTNRPSTANLNTHISAESTDISALDPSPKNQDIKTISTSSKIDDLMNNEPDIDQHSMKSHKDKAIDPASYIRSIYQIINHKVNMCPLNIQQHAPLSTTESMYKNNAAFFTNNNSPSILKFIQSKNKNKEPLNPLKEQRITKTLLQGDTAQSRPANISTISINLDNVPTSNDALSNVKISSKNVMPFSSFAKNIEQSIRQPYIKQRSPTIGQTPHRNDYFILNNKYINDNSSRIFNEDIRKSNKHRNPRSKNFENQQTDKSKIKKADKLVLPIYESNHKNVALKSVQNPTIKRQKKKCDAKDTEKPLPKQRNKSTIELDLFSNRNYKSDLIEINLVKPKNSKLPSTSSIKYQDQIDLSCNSSLLLYSVCHDIVSEEVKIENQLNRQFVYPMSKILTECISHDLKRSTIHEQTRADLSRSCFFTYSQLFGAAKPINDHYTFSRHYIQLSVLKEMPQLINTNCYSNTNAHRTESSVTNTILSHNIEIDHACIENVLLNKNSPELVHAYQNCVPYMDATLVNTYNDLSSLKVPSKLKISTPSIFENCIEHISSTQHHIAEMQSIEHTYSCSYLNSSASSSPTALSDVATCYMSSRSTQYHEQIRSIENYYASFNVIPENEMSKYVHESRQPPVSSKLKCCIFSNQYETISCHSFRMFMEDPPSISNSIMPQRSNPVSIPIDYQYCHPISPPFSATGECYYSDKINVSHQLSIHNPESEKIHFSSISTEIHTTSIALKISTISSEFVSSDHQIYLNSKITEWTNCICSITPTVVQCHTSVLAKSDMRHCPVLGNISQICPRSDYKENLKSKEFDDVDDVYYHHAWLQVTLPKYCVATRCVHYDVAQKFYKLFKHNYYAFNRRCFTSTTSFLETMMTEKLRLNNSANLNINHVSSTSSNSSLIQNIDSLQEIIYEEMISSRTHYSATVDSNKTLDSSLDEEFNSMTFDEKFWNETNQQHISNITEHTNSSHSLDTNFSIIDVENDFYLDPQIPVSSLQKSLSSSFVDSKFHHAQYSNPKIFCNDSEINDSTSNSTNNFSYSYQISTSFKTESMMPFQSLDKLTQLITYSIIHDVFESLFIKIRPKKKLLPKPNTTNVPVVNPNDLYNQLNSIIQSIDSSKDSSKLPHFSQSDSCNLIQPVNLSDESSLSLSSAHKHNVSSHDNHQKRDVSIRDISCHEKEAIKNISKNISIDISQTLTTKYSLSKPSSAPVSTSNDELENLTGKKRVLANKLLSGILGKFFNASNIDNN